MDRTWNDEARALLDPGARGLVRVLGGPGTGKSSLLVDAAVARIRSGTNPEAVLLLTGSGRIGAGARNALTMALLRARPTGAGSAAVPEPLVRTVHSYAYAVLRRSAERAGGPPPRLVTGAEQDAIIRELLAGDLADGPHATVAWPTHLRPALSAAGFATELRNLLARCAERAPPRTESACRGMTFAFSPATATHPTSPVPHPIDALRQARDLQASVPTPGR